MDSPQLSVLADRYVPQNLRSLMMFPPSSILWGLELAKLDVSKFHRQSVSNPMDHRPTPQDIVHGSKTPYRNPTARNGDRSMAEQITEEFEFDDSMDNYCENYSKLMEIERKARLDEFERYTLYQVQLRPHRSDNRYVTVGFPGLRDAKPSIEVGDLVLVRDLMYPITEIQGFVHNVDNLHSEITFTWINTNPMLITMMSFVIRFVPSRVFHSRCLDVLRYWKEEVSRDCSETILFPNEETYRNASLSIEQKQQQKEQENENLNELQQQCVQTILHRTITDTVISPPFCITGPPGTGKTHTVVNMISEVCHSQRPHRILVCAPSHTACDNIALRLLLETKSLFRLNDASRRVESLLNPKLLPHTRIDSGTGTFALPSPAELFAFEIIVCTCSDAAILFEIGFTNAQIRRDRNAAIEAFARVMEDNNGLKTDMDKIQEAVPGFDSIHFTHLFIDEAAQGMEPETLIPFSVVVDDSRPVQIVLCGDPHQLNPQIYSQIARENGLGPSLIERLLQRPCYQRHSSNAAATTKKNKKKPQPKKPLLSVMLKENYRSHPSILMLPSTLFYFNKLRPHRSAKTTISLPHRTRQLVFGSPVMFDHFQPKQESLRPMRTDWQTCFIGVDGQDKCDIENSNGIESWTNNDEAKKIVDIITNLAETIPPIDIGVMTPFRGQVGLIRRLLRQANFNQVNVGTIEDFQGVEQQVIILSCVRTNPAAIPHDVALGRGVLMQPKKINVAITRAISWFIAVGKPDVLIKDPVWFQFLSFCHRNMLWFGSHTSETPIYDPDFEISIISDIWGKRSGDKVIHIHVSDLEAEKRSSLKK